MKNLESYNKFTSKVDEAIWNPFAKTRKFLVLNKIIYPENNKNAEFLSVDPFGEENWTGENIEFNLESIADKIYTDIYGVYYKVDKNVYIKIFNLYADGNILLHELFNQSLVSPDPNIRGKFYVHSSNDDDIALIPPEWIPALNHHFTPKVSVKELFYLNFIKNKPSYRIIKERIK
jgi:hypothetical protein